MAGLPFGLHHWTVNQVIDAALGSASAIIAAGDDPGSLTLLRHELRTAATAERDKAAALGTAIHDAIATGQAIETLPLDQQPRARQFRAWLEASGAELLASEFQVFNLTAGYAGTVDALCRFRDGSVWLIDYKTGKGVYPDHALQLVAYASAEFAGADDLVNEDTTALLRRVSGVAVLHLADDGWEFIAVRHDSETWAAFRGLLEFAVWSHTHPTVDTFSLGKRTGAAK